MSRKIKRFCVFLLFSLFCSLLSGRVSHLGSSKSCIKKENAKGWNSAWAARCCEKGICEGPDGRYCCL